MVAKKSLGDLAIFGGHPAFAETLHVGRPNVGSKELVLERISDLLDRRWLTNAGPLVRDFEARLAEYLGVRHCVAMCNATVALEIAIRALGMKGEVIVPSFTFVATAHALQWQEITPVFCDIDPRTHTIDPTRVEAMLTPRTSGIIGVHTWGRACDVEALSDIARRHGLRLMFDAAHALGCSARGRRIGSFGQAEVFSFHATKVLNTFEGGAVATNDDNLAAKMRLMKNFGFAGYDEVSYIGTNGKMSEPAAAMGLVGLDSLPGFIAHNRRNHEAYRAGLETVPGIDILPPPAGEDSNFHYVVAEIDREAAEIDRDELVELLWAERVLARKYFWPGCHRMEPYRSYYPHARLLLSHTEEVAARVVVLPTGTAVSVGQVDELCALLRFAVAHGRAISERRRAGAEAAGGSSPLVATGEAAGHE
jgi:dTDP-4-amino-4,6-dideoxygalactose transaminase